jgi:hypothetical protein
VTNAIDQPNAAGAMRDGEPAARPADPAGFLARLLEQEGAAFTLGDHLALAISHARITLDEVPWRERSGSTPMPTPIPARRIDAA